MGVIARDSRARHSPNKDVVVGPAHCKYQRESSVSLAVFHGNIWVNKVIKESGMPAFLNLNGQCIPPHLLIRS